VTSYHDRPEVSRSQLADLLRTPAYYHAAHVAKTLPRESTDAMDQGSALHALVLEPETFDRLYVAQTWDGRTKEGKAEAEKHTGKVVLSRSQAAAVHGMAVSIHALPEFARCYDARLAVEEELYWTDAETGIPLRAKPDLVCRLGGMLALVDLKSTSDATADGFARSAEKLRYHLQAAHYLAGYEAVHGERPSTFAFAVVESSAPHLAAMYPMDPEWIAAGESLRRSLLAQLRECMDTNRWPGLPAQTITRPRWAV
jgi:exodeoxyribonuclease VIII